MTDGHSVRLPDRTPESETPRADEKDSLSHISSIRCYGDIRGAVVVQNGKHDDVQWIAGRTP